MAVPDSLLPTPLTDQLQRLQQFRRRVYTAFTTWPDTLFETTDALLCHPTRLDSLPHLSLEPVARRGHGSLYAALAHGRIDTTALADILTSALDPANDPVFALDCSAWRRPEAPTSPERTMNYDAVKDNAARQATRRGSVVTPGWWCQWLVHTGTSHSSWVVPVDLARIGPAQDHNVLAAIQIQALATRLSTRPGPGQPRRTPIVCLDGDYSPAYLGTALAGWDVGLLVRVRRDGVMFTDPPPRPPGTIGRPRVHGPRMKLSRPDTWPAPGTVLTVPASGRHAALTVTAWHRMHPRASESAALHEPGNDPHRPTTRAIRSGSVIQIRSADPRLRPIWLFWAGPAGSFDLDRIWQAYLRRYDIEHLFRFLKQYLGWTRPRVRSPQQALRWSWLVAVAYVQLTLARGLVTDQCLPWERPGMISPLRVKRGFRGLHPYLGTPARPPKTSRPGPGRPRGRTSIPAPRYPITRKTVTT